MSTHADQSADQVEGGPSCAYKCRFRLPCGRGCTRADSADQAGELSSCVYKCRFCQPVGGMYVYLQVLILPTRWGCLHVPTCYHPIWPSACVGTCRTPHMTTPVGIIGTCRHLSIAYQCLQVPILISNGRQIIVDTS